MIMVKVGDKVRFLNAVGGGIVRRVDRDVALVEEEDGFETPVLVRECVVIESGRRQDDGVVPADKQEPARRAVKQPVAAVRPDDEEAPEWPLVETRTGERLSLYLAFVPDAVNHLGSTTFETYLINDSNYYLDYTYAVSGETGEWTLCAHGTLEPNVQVCVESFGQDAVNRFGRVSVQALAYKRGKGYACKEPVSALLRIDPVKFYKLHTFGANDFFEEKAWVLPLVEGDLPAVEIPLDAKVLEKAMQEKNTPQQPRKIPRHKAPKEGPVEVDLHIHELVDTTAGMSNADMLQLQLQTFRDTLDRYKGEKGRKIIFIHGKGDGVLRRAILEELQRKYKNYEYQDASFREYGFGATQVTIR